ncbi:SET domain-containing protein [Paraburkholderia sp. Ac-20342]|nr:SET domain-containing protein [Paraburkholderia sp. Ac-20342]NIF50941.1 SET domain-containing protein [Burkholderia sp. Ax-1724]
MPIVGRQASQPFYSLHQLITEVKNWCVRLLLITHAAALRRHPENPFHTFLFALSDGRYCIDARNGGNAARWINHRCAPNCEAIEERDREGVLERVDQIAANRAAEAAAAHLDHDVFTTVRDEQVVEPDLTELVDQHQCIRHFRLLHHPVQHRRLAAAEKPRQQGDRYHVHRTLPVSLIQRPRIRPLRVLLGARAGLRAHAVPSASVSRQASRRWRHAGSSISTPISTWS